MKALLGTSQHLVYSSFILTITLSSFPDHDLTFVFPTCQAQVPPKDLKHYEGISSPTWTWSGLPISSTSAGTFLPRPLKSPSLDDCHWTSSAHRQRQRPSGEVRYSHNASHIFIPPLPTQRPRHVIPGGIPSSAFSS